MSDNYTTITFPLDGDKLTVRISYQIVGNVRAESGSSPAKRHLFSLDLDFKYLFNGYLPRSPDGQVGETPTANGGPQWPTVHGVLGQLRATVLDKLRPVLGKNIQVISMSLTSDSRSVNVPLYVFGTSNRNAMPSDTTLYFVMQPVHRKTTHRLYLRGAGLDFVKMPLEDAEHKAIYELETVFTSALNLFEGSVLLQYIRSNDVLISCVFRGPVQFAKKTAPSPSRGRRRGRPKKGPDGPSR